MTCEYPEEFERLWNLLPRRDANNPKRAAYKAYLARLKEGVKQADLERAASNYCLYARQKGILGTALVMMGQTFLGPGWRFESFLGLPEPKPALDPKQAAKTPVAAPEERIDARPFLSELIKSLGAAKRSPTCA